MVIKASKCTVSEIWRDFFGIGMYVVSLHIEFTDSMISSHIILFKGIAIVIVIL